MFSLLPWRTERKGPERLARTEHPLSLFRPEIDEWFDRFFARWPLLGEGWLTEPEMTMEETDEALVVRTDAPGFEAAEFDIRVGGNTLTITAEHKVAGEGKEPTIERRLERTLTLPTAVIPEKVTAKYVRGVLEITLPRIEAVKRLKVEVKPT